jgi:hypothetical protein
VSDFNVVEIRTRRRRGKPYVEQCYTCGCGGQMFLLLPDGECVCCACNHINTPLQVIYTPPETPT